MVYINMRGSSETVSYVTKQVYIKGIGAETIAYSDPQTLIQCIRDIKEKYDLGSIKVKVNGEYVSPSDLYNMGARVLSVESIEIEPYDYGA